MSMISYISMNFYEYLIKFALSLKNFISTLMVRRSVQPAEYIQLAAVKYQITQLCVESLTLLRFYSDEPGQQSGEMAHHLKS